MAKLLHERFVCAWEKKGTLKVVKVKPPEAKPGTLTLGPQIRRIGGNVLGYVCTPTGAVLHVIPAVAPEQWLGELAWALTLSAELQKVPAYERMTAARVAHEKRVKTLAGQWQIVYSGFLVERALKPIAAVEKAGFETLAGQAYQPDVPVDVQFVDQKTFTTGYLLTRR